MRGRRPLACAVAARRRALAGSASDSVTGRLHMFTLQGERPGSLHFRLWTPRGGSRPAARRTWPPTPRCWMAACSTARTCPSPLPTRGGRCAPSSQYTAAFRMGSSAAPAPPALGGRAMWAAAVLVPVCPGCPAMAAVPAGSRQQGTALVSHSVVKRGPEQQKRVPITLQAVDGQA